MTHPNLGTGASDHRTVRGSDPRTTSQPFIGRSMRRGVALALSPLVASAGMVGIASTADAAVTTAGAAIAVIHDHDFVEAAGYGNGQALKVEVLRNGTPVAVAHGSGPAF